MNHYAVCVHMHARTQHSVIVHVNFWGSKLRTLRLILIPVSKWGFPLVIYAKISIFEKGNTQKLQLGYVTLMKSWTKMVESSNSSVVEFVVLSGNCYLYFILRSVRYRLLFFRA